MISKEVKKYIKKPLNEYGSKNRRSSYLADYEEDNDNHPNIRIDSKVTDGSGRNGEVVSIDGQDVVVLITYDDGDVEPFELTFQMSDLECLDCDEDDDQEFENPSERQDYEDRGLEDYDDLNETDESPEETYEEMIDRLDGMTDDEEQEMSEEDTSELCECGGELNEGLCLECGKGLNENKMRITSKEMKNLINTMIIQETSVNGMTVTKNVLNQSKKDSDQHLKDVAKKLKEQGVEDPFKVNTVLPQPNKGKKIARENTKEQEEEIADNRGYGMEDMKWDVEPSQQFKDRMKLAIMGDPTMGNSQEYANVIKSDLGVNIVKKMDRKKKKEEDQPMYNKDPQPVKIVSEEIERMKKLSNYNKKTQ